jgi:uncharacterized membrane protein YqjE
MISPREESEMPSERKPVGAVGGQEAGTDTLDPWMPMIRAELRSLVESVRRTAFVELQRLHLKAVDGFFRGGLYVCLLCMGAALSISGVLLLSSGTRGILAAWTGKEWLAELLTGAFLLMVFWFGGLAARSVLRTHVLRNTEKRLTADRPAQGQTGSAGEG